jgi:hypothetical protein
MPSPPSLLHPNSDQYPPKCYHWNISGFSSKEHYESHGIRHHVGLTLYPGPADLKALGLGTPRYAVGERSQNKRNI